jgi:transposase-like protein
VNCKYCGSSHVIKLGTFNGVQRYWCNDCKRKFVAGTLPKMKTDTNVISAALSCYFGGMPLDSIQRHLEQQYGHYYTEMGIYQLGKAFCQRSGTQDTGFPPSCR